MASTKTLGPDGVELSGVDDASKAKARNDNLLENGRSTNSGQDAPAESGGILKKISDGLANALPPQTSVDVHDLRKTGFAQFIAFGFMVTYLIVLVYSSVVGFNQLRDEAFLSADIYAGDCDEVPLALTSVYEADSQGLWDTENGYVPTKSMYALDMRGTTVNTIEYPQVMEEFSLGFQRQARKSVDRDLSYNMLALASFNLGNVDKQMSLFTNARAEKVFGSVIFTQGITDANGFCFSENYATYDPDAARLSYHFTLDDDTNPYFTLCEQLNPNDFGTDDLLDGVKTLNFDIRSFSTAVAINLGMTDLRRDLVKINPRNGYFTETGFVYIEEYQGLARYVDPFYTNMAPIVCFNGAPYGMKDYCLLEGVDLDFYYPMITHLGHWSEEKMCTCGETGTINDDSMLFYCSESDFMMSIVYVSSIHSSSYYNYNPDSYDVFQFGAEISQILAANPETGDIDIVKTFHSAQFRSIYGFDLAPLTEAFTTLCQGKCTMFTIEFWGANTNPMNFRGTPVYAMYNDTAMISCADGLYRPEAMEPLITKPPVTLIQAYYTCVLNATVAAQRALGIAAGSATLYSGIVLQVLLFASIYGYNLIHSSDDKIRNPAIKKEHMERDVAMLKSGMDTAAEKHRSLEAQIAELRKKISAT
jgi:hypothetical protein